jgi:hypothetical protein
MKRETPAAIRRRLKQLGCTPEQIERHVVWRDRLPPSSKVVQQMRKTPYGWRFVIRASRRYSAPIQ